MSDAEARAPVPSLREATRVWIEVALESFGGTLEVLPMGLALGAGVALMRFHTGMIRTLLVCAAIGLVARLA